MALQLPITTRDGETLDAYLVPAAILFDVAGKRAEFRFTPYRSREAFAQGLAPVQFDQIVVIVPPDQFDSIAKMPAKALWNHNGEQMPADATIYEVIARLAYGLGKTASPVLATAEDV